MREISVYFIQGIDGGPIKIGRAKDPQKRLRDLQVASPVKLVIRRSFKTTRDADEKDLHSAFSVLRLHGEWFAPHPALARVADAIADPSIPAASPPVNRCFKGSLFSPPVLRSRRRPLSVRCRCRTATPLHSRGC